MGKPVSGYVECLRIMGDPDRGRDSIQHLGQFLELCPFAEFTLFQCFQSQLAFRDILALGNGCNNRFSVVFIQRGGIPEDRAYIPA